MRVVHQTVGDAAERVMIESASPPGWRELQDSTARILTECGLKAFTNVRVRLARGIVNVDVLAKDPTATPPA
jgi:hypothetical protein